MNIPTLIWYPSRLKMSLDFLESLPQNLCVVNIFVKNYQSIINR